MKSCSGRSAGPERPLGGPDSTSPNVVQDNPTDMELGPDGALYTLEYGDGFFSAALTPTLTIRFSSAGTRDLDGDRIAYAWDFNADGVVDSRVTNRPSRTRSAASMTQRCA